MSTTINGVPMPPHTRYLTKIFNVMACKNPLAVSNLKSTSYWVKSMVSLGSSEPAVTITFESNENMSFE